MNMYAQTSRGRIVTGKVPSSYGRASSSSPPRATSRDRISKSNATIIDEEGHDNYCGSVSPPARLHCHNHECTLLPSGGLLPTRKSEGITSEGHSVVHHPCTVDYRRHQHHDGPELWPSKKCLRSTNTPPVGWPPLYCKPQEQSSGTLWQEFQHTTGNKQKVPSKLAGRKSLLRDCVNACFKAPLLMVKFYCFMAIQSIRWYLGLYHAARIVVGIFCLLAIYWIGQVCILRPSKYLGRLIFGGKNGRLKIQLHRQLKNANTYDEWRNVSCRLDTLTDAQRWINSTEPSSSVDYDALNQHIQALRFARQTENLAESMFLLRVCCHRNFAGIRHASLYAHSFVQTKTVVDKFYDEVLLSLDFLAMRVNTTDEYNGTSVTLKNNNHNTTSSNNTNNSTTGTISQKRWIELLSDLRLSMGRTALCLSGGGGLAIYHLGVINVLMDNNLLPNVVSGSSGGSLIAAMLATRTDNEFRESFQHDFMEKRGVRLAQPILQQIASFWRTGYLLDKANFIKLARSLIGEITFAEGFARTGRFVSITTTPAGRVGGEPLVCNIINTPDVLVWSAVVASCSLPMIMSPSCLYAKKQPPSVSPTLRRINATLRSGVDCAAFNNSSADDSNSCTVEEAGLRKYCQSRFVDGSILEDIPHNELQTLFNVKSFVVTQVNPHFAPFIQEPSSYKESKRIFAVLLDHLWNYVTLDVRNRYARLLLLALVPKIRGQDVSPFLMQSAEGHVTIVPAPPADFWKMTYHASPKEVASALTQGQRKTWPYLKRLTHAMMIEQKLRDLWQEQASSGSGLSGQKLAYKPRSMNIRQEESKSFVTPKSSHLSSSSAGCRMETLSCTLEELAHG